MPAGSRVLIVEDDARLAATLERMLAAAARTQGVASVSLRYFNAAGAVGTNT